MNKKLLKKLKLITLVCSIILIVEIIFIGYFIFYKNKESLYFDGINAVVSEDNNLVTVGSNNNNDNHFEKAKVSKYNEKREKTFEKLYNIGYNSVFFGVALDDEDIVAVGSFEKTDSDHEDSVRRALIVKYDSQGELVFDSDFKILDNSKFTAIKKVGDNYYVTGQSIYKNTKVGTKSGGAVLAKYDNDGNLMWSKTYGSSKSAIYNDLIVVNNNIYTIGMDDNNLGIICKYDLDGNLIASNGYEYTDDIGFSGIVNIGDYIFISGSNSTNGDNANAMIVKYDLNCNYLDEVIYKGDGITRYNRIIKDNHDNLIVIGIMTSNMKSNNKTVDSVNYDGIVGKYDFNLKPISVVQYGDDKDDYFTDIKMVDGEYLVVGYSLYEDGSYLSKFIRYSDALKVLGVD